MTDQVGWRTLLHRMAGRLLQVVRGQKALTAALAVVAALIIVLAVIVWPSRTGILDEPVIIGTGTDAPRITFQDEQNKRSGFDVEFYRWLATSHDPPFVPSEIDVNIGNRELVLRGDHQVRLVFSSYSITTVRERQIDFAGPYLRTQQAVMVRSSDLATFKGLSDLRGQKVCAQSGATSISGIAGIPEAIAVPKETLTECMNGLKDGEFKAVSTDELVLLGYQQHFPQGGVSVVPNLTFGALQEWGIGLPPGPGTQNCEEMTKWIRKFIDSGQWDIVFKNNFHGLDPARFKPESKNLRECIDDTDEQ